MPFTIKVNNVQHDVDVDGDMPLLWVLRDVLGMTGTKFGCGMALCGACTVHIDGTPIRSCITPIHSVGDVGVTTIEAIGATTAGAASAEGVARSRGRPVRLLPVGPDHVRGRAAREQSQSERRRYRRRNVRQYLPLRHLFAHSRRRSSRRRKALPPRLRGFDHVAPKTRARERGDDEVGAQPVAPEFLASWGCRRRRAVARLCPAVACCPNERKRRRRRTSPRTASFVSARTGGSR